MARSRVCACTLAFRRAFSACARENAVLSFNEHVRVCQCAYAGLFASG